MVLLIDIGNTNTHIGLGDAARVQRRTEFPTAVWSGARAESYLKRFVKDAQLDGAAVCSVVPQATVLARRILRRLRILPVFELTARTVRTIGIEYPKPSTIGPDRLANAAAARHRFGAPVVAIDFGTAVTIDVVDQQGNFVGGIIAPGLDALLCAMHERTALLPRVQFRKVSRAIGRSTKEAMLLGAQYALTGLVHEALVAIKRELGTEQLQVVATGGCARLLCHNLRELTALVPDLTLEGLRLQWFANLLET
ncbi:MAG: type III pantothenate kinase [Verrucomicrobiae bacterium]|nr:type III pantothenate kinase [Verrucomicrobiae bacterium]MDW7981005.1 type III pantothenate kinase [Verrucomicrobiales bacterium]